MAISGEQKAKIDFGSRERVYKKENLVSRKEVNK